MFEDFFLRALLAAVGVAVLAGPLGCFVVWNRMAYFGDAMAHSALLGVGLGLLLGVNPTAAVAVTALATALLLIAMQYRARVHTDTLLGILAHATLSLGLVLLGFMAWVRVDLMGYLFGDVLAVSRTDLALVWGGGALALGLLAVVWRPLLAITLNEDLARAEGVPALRYRITFVALVAIVIAIAMKVVGVLLITALLIVPAAAARVFATSPEGMALLAAAMGAAASIAGLLGSLELDTPSGPSIVVAALLLFLASLSRSLRRPA